MSLKPEEIVHINLVNWFHHEYPELADDFHHFANERRCSINEGRKLKRMGVKKGVSDFFLAMPIHYESGQYMSGLWLELKVGKGKISQEQSEFLRRKTLRGYAAFCVWGEDAAKAVIRAYLNRNV